MDDSNIPKKARETKKEWVVKMFCSICGTDLKEENGSFVTCNCSLGYGSSINYIQKMQFGAMEELKKVCNEKRDSAEELLDALDEKEKQRLSEPSNFDHSEDMLEKVKEPIHGPVSESSEEKPWTRDLRILENKILNILKNVNSTL